jgi:hypothetical protein
MNLTPELKAKIDELDYESLLRKWRFAVCGAELFQGASGEYFKQRMIELRDKHPEPHVVSKRVGWN